MAKNTKKTTARFIEEAVAVHGNRYDYSKVDYVNQRTKIVIICPVHGVFSQTPKNHLNGQGCPECGKDYAKHYHKNNYQNLLDWVKKEYDENQWSFPHIKQEYENHLSSITIHCNKCGYEFQQRAIDFKRYHHNNCPNCRKIKHTEQKIVDNTHVCPIHGEFYSTTGECPQCRQELHYKQVQQEILDKLNEWNVLKTVEVDLSNVKSKNDKFPCRCKICGYTFYRKKEQFRYIKHEVCPQCTLTKLSKERTKTTEEFIEEVKSLYGDDTFDFTETVYEASDKKVTLKCNKCGRSFTKEANSLLQGKGCPHHRRNKSKGEEELIEFIRSLNVGEVLTNDRMLLDGYELDVYVPDKKIAIEYDGLYWHSECVKPNDYHINKTKACEAKGVHLIHIFEDEWQHKSNIWKSMLSNTFGLTQTKIFARKCQIRELTYQETSDFLNENHLQGGLCYGTIRYGLIYNNEIVSVMLLGKPRSFAGGRNHEYELIRFCNKLNTNVVGGASKIFRHFIKMYEPSSVVSYADRRWSTGNLYHALGFKLYNQSRPNYYYIVNAERKYRYNFRKSVLVKKYGCPIDMSEREFCKMKHWWRIYDCGCLCFEWFKNC